MEHSVKHLKLNQDQVQTLIDALEASIDNYYYNNEFPETNKKITKLIDIIKKTKYSK